MRSHAKIPMLGLVIVVTSAFPARVIAQSDSLRFPGRTTYSRARIYFPDNSRHDVRGLVIENDRLIYRLDSARDPTEVDLSEVYLIKVSSGSRALQYALYGALASGAGAALSLVALEASDTGDESDINGAALVVGFTAVGFAVGALLGSGERRWRDLYVRDERASSSASIRPFLRFDSAGASPGVRLTLTVP